MKNMPGENFRTIWLHPDDPATVQIIDQRRLPHRYEVVDLRSSSDGAFAIREMLVRGAPLIGATAAWSVYLAALEARASGTPRRAGVATGRHQREPVGPQSSKRRAARALAFETAQRLCGRHVNVSR